MSTLINGFVEIPTLANNEAGQTASIGELSLKARSYSREKQFIADDTEAGVELVIFSAVSSGVHLGNLDSTYCAEVLALINLIRSNYLITEDLSDYLATVATGKFSDFEYGELITKDGVTLPSYLFFTHSDNGGVDYKLWFSDSSFLNDYEGYELVVIPPSLDIDNLKVPHTDALSAIANLTYPLQVEAIESAKGNYPYTNMTVYQLVWNDPADISLTITTNWTILGYGKQALRTEYILAAIRDYLTNNSVYTLTDWMEYFPVLTTVNTFTLIPLWNDVALQAGEGIDSLHRPVVTFGKVLNVGPIITIGRTETDYIDFSETFPLLYKNLMVVSIADSTNEESFSSFEGMYPDYTIIELNDQSANRLAASTQSIIVTLDALARACYTDTGYNELPTGMSRIKVSGLSFLEKANNNVVYRMVTRSTFIAAVGS